MMGKKKLFAIILVHYFIFLKGKPYITAMKDFFKKILYQSLKCDIILISSHLKNEYLCMR